MTDAEVVELMKAKQHRLTKRQAQVFQDLFDLRKTIHGVQARDYLTRYIQLKEQSIRLKKMGLKVRISLPDFPRRPLLIIENDASMVLQHSGIK